MSILPLVVVVQASVLSTWSMVMLAAFVVTRDDDLADHAPGVDLTARTVVADD